MYIQKKDVHSESTIYVRERPQNVNYYCKSNSVKLYHQQFPGVLRLKIAAHAVYCMNLILTVTESIYSIVYRALWLIKLSRLLLTNAANQQLKDLRQQAGAFCLLPAKNNTHFPSWILRPFNILQAWVFLAKPPTRS